MPDQVTPASAPLPPPLMERILSKLLGEQSFGVPSTPPAVHPTPAPVTSPIQPDRGVIGNTAQSLRDLLKQLVTSGGAVPNDPVTGQPVDPQTALDVQLKKSGAY